MRPNSNIFFCVVIYIHLTCQIEGIFSDVRSVPRIKIDPVELRRRISLLLFVGEIFYEKSWIPYAFICEL